MKWKRKTLEEVADFSLGKMLDQKKNKGMPLPYLANVNVLWGRFDLGKLRQMRFEPHEADRYGLRAGDIVMCEGGEAGRCAIWKDEVPGVMIQKALHRIRPHTGLDHRFLFYSLLHQGRSGGFDRLFTGATIKHLPREKLARIEIDIPPLPTQERIASILGAYDDLIELNRRRIALLEEMARRLFEEWFVHFRFPDHEDHAMIETADGPLPEGWEWRPMNTVCVQPNGIQTGPFGSQLHQSDYVEDGVPVVMPKNIIDLHILEDSIARIAEEKANELVRHRMSVGDVVYGRRGDIGRRAYISTRENGWFCGTGCLRLRPDARQIWPRYFFDTLGLRATLSAIRARAQGATMPNLSAGAMSDVPVLVPPFDLQSKYAEIVEPLASLSANIQSANVKLVLSRDLLLARLISGELSVAAAERELEAVA